MMEQNTKRLIRRLRSLSNDALVQHILGSLIRDIAEAADRLDELSKAQSEPVAWTFKLATCKLNGDCANFISRVSLPEPHVPDEGIDELQPLYTFPPKRLPLRDSDIERMIFNWDDKDEEMDLVDFARAIEKAHGIE